MFVNNIMHGNKRTNISVYSILYPVVKVVYIGLYPAHALIKVRKIIEIRLGNVINPSAASPKAQSASIPAFAPMKTKDM